jgi:ABC-type uncharacterized transport system ATPase subunit
MHLSVKGITKRFGPVLANDRIDLEAGEGEIHSILGENGAGKTTLMNILCGLYQADEGEIFVNGQKVKIRSPRDSIKLGIGMVHQHFLLVPPFTVAENVILGHSGNFGMLNIRRVEEQIRSLSSEYGLEVDPSARVWQLSVGTQQRVEILKAFYRGAELLILDEPTSVLTPQEADELFNFLRRLKSNGATIIFITHKLNEVMAISDSITVLRDGKVVGTVAASDTNPQALSNMMVGREVFLQFDRKPSSAGDEILSVQNLHVQDDRGLGAVRGISFSVRQGKVFGIAGVDGNGQQEIAEAIFGLRRVEDGDIFLDGEKVTDCAIREMIERRVALIPADRLKTGLIPGFSVLENCILGYQDEHPFASGLINRERGSLLMDHQAVESHARSLVDRFGIRTPSTHAMTYTLSGGNLQRLVLARALACEPRLIIAVNPTRGLDIGATEFVRKQLLQQRDLGRTVLLISVDLDEICCLSDEIAVLYRGQIMGMVSGDEVDLEEIGLMMAGVMRQNLDQDLHLRDETLD